MPLEIAMHEEGVINVSDLETKSIHCTNTIEISKNQEKNNSDSYEELFQEYNLDVVNEKFDQENFTESKILASAIPNTNEEKSLELTLLVPKIELHNCKNCHNSFGTKSNLKKHGCEAHELKKPYKTTFNSLQLISNEAKSLFKDSEKYSVDVWEKSRSDIHEEKKPYKCQKCDFVFSSAGNLKLHISAVHEKKKSFKCSGCDYRSSLKAHIAKHLKDRHKNKRYEIMYLCTVCDESFSSKIDLKNHVYKVHDKQKDDRVKSQAESFSAENLKPKKEDFDLLKKDETKLQSEIIGNSSFNNDPLNIHVSQEINSSEQSIDEKVIQDQSMNGKIFHEKDNPYKCSFCNVTFLSSENVKQHISIVHEGNKWRI